MRYLNQVILFTLATFMLLGALDRILSQFDGARRLLAKMRLSWVSNALAGAGRQFEDGLNAMGALALAMVGIIAATPILSRCLAPLVVPIYTRLGASPSVFATSLLALDMGGYNLAGKLATVNGQLDWPSFLYSALILGSMLGPTIVFTIPIGLGMIRPSDKRAFALGILAGLTTIPLGCLAGGLVAAISDVHTSNGQLVVFKIGQLMHNLTPVVILSVLLALGLWRFPQTMVKGFSIFAKLLVAFMTVALAAVAFQTMTGLVLLPGMDPVFPLAGDKPGLDVRAVELVGRLALVLTGAYPAAYLLSRWFNKRLMAAGKLLGINDVAAAGLVAILASNLPMFKMLADMDERGKVLNMAFAVSAAWVFADHLAFAAANKPDMIVAMIAGKLVGGVSAVAVAMLITRGKGTVSAG